MLRVEARKDTRVAKSERQKYNFLAALLTQVEESCDEGAELYKQYRDQLTQVYASENSLDYQHHADILQDLEVRMTNMERTYDDLNRWLAQLELALEELDDDGSEGSGEEPIEDDDGDDDHAVVRVEPPMGGTRPTDRRVAAPLGAAGRVPGTRAVTAAPRVVTGRTVRQTGKSNGS